VVEDAYLAAIVEATDTFSSLIESVINVGLREPFVAHLAAEQANNFFRDRILTKKHIL
jgi:hypothetical protein